MGSIADGQSVVAIAAGEIHGGAATDHIKRVASGVAAERVESGKRQRAGRADVSIRRIQVPGGICVDAIQRIRVAGRGVNCIESREAAGRSFRPTESIRC